jgi:hypothetical protein
MKKWVIYIITIGFYFNEDQIIVSIPNGPKYSKEKQRSHISLYKSHDHFMPLQIKFI